MLTPTTNKEMKNYSSMKTGGMASCVYFPENEEELCSIVKTLKSRNERYIVLGNISNVLLPDGEIKATLIVTTEMKKTQLTSDTTVYAEAGVSLTKLSFDMCKSGLSGLEFAYGIPGSVGGAVYMNAGAYGGETSEVIRCVKALDKNGDIVTLSRDECDFSYRSSVFQNDEYCVLGAEFELKCADSKECVNAAKEFMQRRIEKQPLEYPSCGSTFKRPEGHFAGALIEQAGLKGAFFGGAKVSEKHAGFVVNYNDATTQDVLTLMRKIRQVIKDEFGVMLEAEIKLLDKNGEFFPL